MTYNFTRTREQLARMALRKLGVLGAGADVSADMEIAYEAIDLRLKEMHKRGIFWRKVDEVALEFSTGVISASATDDILFPIKMFVRDGSADEQVSIIGIREYASINNKRETGTPQKALWRGGAEFFLWPVPDSTVSLGLIYEKITTDTTAGAAPDVEASMLRWLKDLVAYDIGDDFGQSEQRMLRFAQEAEKAERNIQKLSVEHKDFTTIAVDDFDGRAYERHESDYGR